MYRLTLIFLATLAANGPVSASILSWITGSSDSNITPLTSETPVLQPKVQILNGKSVMGSPGRPAFTGGVEYPEESGECSHWGNAGLAPFSTREPLPPTFIPGMPLPGELLGSHPRVPIGTIVSVTNTKTGKSVRVRVVPPKSIVIVGRIMDLSPAAFSQVENVKEGVFACSVKVVQTPRTEMYSLSSHVFDNGLKGGMSSIVPPPLITHLGQTGDLGLLGRNENSNRPNYTPFTY